ncbi:MAG: LutB/LldF family L-lactate oxidation iron-sulfur protein [Pyrinomonadaceae bacterium]
MSHPPTVSTETFDTNALAALADTTLRDALRNATGHFAQRRRAALSNVRDWEGLRERARQIKDEILRNLDLYLAEFAAHAESAGAFVHWARDAEEACRIVATIAHERQAKMIIKSKSMTTEEIELNHALKKENLEPIETDLGEWIIQLAGEMPSHIIAPAIHKSKKQIAELFTEKLGIEPTDDIQVLTNTARTFLRQSFAEADLGISGVNFGIVETGSFLVLENEGNIRMTTTLPATHIAVMGIEKLIPRFADLDIFLKLLPRSGSGQQLTTYQSIITGPKRNKNDEGPDEVHIVLLDNGRSRMLAHPVTRQSLACIRCGACLNACPVYQQIGGHAYGSVYPGPIGAVITPQLIGLKKASQLPYASSLCGACREVCPVKIDIPELLLHLRSEIIDGGVEGMPGKHPVKSPVKQKLPERLTFRLWSMMMKSPRLYEFGALVGRVLQPLIVRGDQIGKQSRFVRMFMPPLGAWTKARDLRPLAKRSFREIWNEKEF